MDAVEAEVETQAGAELDITTALLDQSGWGGERVLGIRHYHDQAGIAALWRTLPNGARVACVGTSYLICDVGVYAPGDKYYWESIRGIANGPVELKRVVVWLAGQLPCVFETTEEPDDQERHAARAFRYTIANLLKRKEAELVKLVEWHGVKRGEYRAQLTIPDRPGFEYALGVMRTDKQSYSWRLLERARGDKWRLVAETGDPYYLPRVYPSSRLAQRTAVEALAVRALLYAIPDEKAQETVEKYLRGADKTLAKYLTMDLTTGVVGGEDEALATLREELINRFTGLINFHDEVDTSCNGYPSSPQADLAAKKHIADEVLPQDVYAVLNELQSLHEKYGKRGRDDVSLRIADLIVSISCLQEINERLEYFKRHRLRLYLEAMRLVTDDGSSLSRFEIHTQFERELLSRIYWLLVTFGKDHSTTKG